MAVKFFLHTCSDCRLRYRILLHSDKQVIFRTRCPDCRAKYFFDNRDGGLEMPRRKLLSRAIRQYDLREGVDYRPNTKSEPEMIPAELVHRQTDQEQQSVAVHSEPAGEPATIQEPPLVAEPAAGTEPITISEPSAAEEPSEAAEPPANKEPSADREPPVINEPSANGEPPVTQEPSEAEEPPAITPPTPPEPAANQEPTTPTSVEQEPPAAEPELEPKPANEDVPAAAAAATDAAENDASLPLLLQPIEKKTKLPAQQVVAKEPGVPLRIRLGELLSRARQYLHDALERAASYAGSLIPPVYLEKMEFAMGKLRGSRRYFLLAFVVVALYLGASFRFPMLLFFKDPRVIETRMQPVQPNRIVDRDGRLIAELFSRKTSNIRIEEFPPALRRKLLFIEDGSFQDHGGIRFASILRAALSNFMARSYVEGGSTITQQLSRILMRDREKAFLRKFKEAILAVHLERNFSKDAILTAYINHVYLGHGAYGLQTAARFYLNKSLRELNFTEQLMLITLLPAPETLSPLRNPARLEQRMDLLYARMVRESYATSPANVYRRQKNDLFESFNRSPNENVFSRRVNHAPYVAEYIRITLARILGRSHQYNENITIHTTLDGELQKAAVKETVAYINNISHRYPPVRIEPDRDKKGKPRKRPRLSLRERINREYHRAAFAAYLTGLPRPRGKKAPRLQAAAVGVQPETGEILFMQGGSGFSAGNQLNRALGMRRQTGSAIKPIVFSAGIEHGVITPATILLDEPTALDGENPNEPGLWKPRNYHDDYRGEVTVRETLRYSLNVPSVLVGKRIGMNRLSAHFRRFFFTDPAAFKKRFRRDLTIAIGSLEMSPLEMALAYSAFGNNGRIRRPYLIRRITDAGGKILYEQGKHDEFNTRLPRERRVLSGDVAMVMASMLRDSGRRGGAYRGGFRGKNLLGKTGTTNDHRDAWFIGVTPGLSAAVWVGYDNPSNSMGKGTGAGVAGPLWGRIAKHARVGDKFQFEPRAVFHRVCVKSGLRASRKCRRTRTEIFPRSEHPPHRCRLHSRSRLKKSPPTAPPPPATEPDDS